MSFLLLLILVAAFMSVSPHGQACCRYECKEGDVLCPMTLHKIGTINPNDNKMMNKRLEAIEENMQRWKREDNMAKAANYSPDLLLAYAEEKMNSSIEAALEKLGVSTPPGKGTTPIPDTSSSASHFVDGYYQASNKVWYKRSIRRSNYEAAKNDCARNGSRLASTGIRDDIVRNELFDKGITSLQYTWIGLRKQNGQWAWSDEGEYNATETAWAAYEPNNSGGIEDCGHLTGHTMLNDKRCSQLNYYLCEKSL